MLIMKINKYMEYKCENGRMSEMNYLKGFSILTIVLMHLLAFVDVPKKIITLSAVGGAGVHVFSCVLVWDYILVI